MSGIPLIPGMFAGPRKDLLLSAKNGPEHLQQSMFTGDLYRSHLTGYANVT